MKKIFFTMIVLSMVLPESSWAGTKSYKIWEASDRRFTGSPYVTLYPNIVASLKKTCEEDYKGVLDEDSLRAAKGYNLDAYKAIIYGVCTVNN
jgi:hypothetical protein